MALNVHTSVLLLAYLLGTAGLGIFWVASQQLPVFDWHYLFDYATLLLVALHLVFNFPIVLRWLDKRRGKSTSGALRGGPLDVGKIAGLVVLLGVALYIGKRQGGGDIRLDIPISGHDHPIVRYHAFSSESRQSVFRRAPGVAWGDAPPPFKRYDDANKIALTKGSPGKGLLGERLHHPALAARFTVAELGRLLHLFSGITLRRGGHALRASPSSGALFPSELYIVARRVDGLAPGLYHYDPEHHRLSALGPEPNPPNALASDDADAVVLLSAIFRRTGYKYHNRAYRYALADAGHLLENMRLAAHDAPAAQALAIDGVEEAVLAVVPLRKSAELIDAPCATQQRCTAPARQFAPVVPATGTSIGVTGIVHQATSLRLLPHSEAADIALPTPIPAGRDLYSTIVQRRSKRRYAPAALTITQLAGQLADLNQRPLLFGAINIDVVVNRVAGLTPGVYRYLPGHKLRRVRTGQFAVAARSAALSQDAIGEAAAVLVLSAERDKVLADGPRGYRHALLEAGMIGERWLLGAVARGMAGCPVGAFYDDEAAALIGVDGTRH